MTRPLLLVLFACACSNPAQELPVASADLADPPAPDLTLTADLLPAGCPRRPPPADRARKVVVSLPYDKGGGKANRYALYDLAADGTLTLGAERFELGRATGGRIAFTPDGEIGLVAQEDGTLGVFRLRGGAPEVVHAAYKGAFYAHAVVSDPAGDVAYVLDAQWRENGGGIYTVRIGCDGTLSGEEKLAPARLPRAMALLPALEGHRPRAVLGARDVLDSRPGDTGHVVELGQPPRLSGGDNVFRDDKGSINAVAVEPAGGLVLLADNDEFSGIPNRVAAMELSDAGLDRLQDPIEINDPVSLAMSPYGNAALVVSGYGDAIFALSYDASAPVGTAPVKLVGQPAYRGAKPQLPDSAVVIQRGALRGKVLVSENLGVRQLRFQADGALVDEGLLKVGAGLESIVGAIGVQP